MSGTDGSRSAEKDHTPVEVSSVEGMPFVRCSCDLTSGFRPQSAVWLRDHWQGSQDAGVAALVAVVARQRDRSGAADPAPRPEGSPS